MRTFAWTSLVRVIIILGARVYMTNFQSDSLYNFLNLNNPATNAVESCMNQVQVIQSGNKAELDVINSKLDIILSGNSSTVPNPVPTLNTITTGAANTSVTGNNVRLITN